MPSFVRRYCWWILVILMASVPLGYRRPVSPMSNPRVTRENDERIKPGMTLKQVEEVHNDNYHVAISVSFDASDLVESAIMLPTVEKVHR
jgi:hypothetical protein